MSEIINNSKERQDKLKDLIKKIHAGMPLDEAKKLFKKNFQEISTDEIVTLEQALIDEGMQVEEIQSLCDVHAAVFDKSISDIHKPKDITRIPGHPAKVFSDENKQIEELIENELEPYLEKVDTTSYLMLRIGMDRLANISKHYARKEYLFFPSLEKKGIDSIPKVMWGVDDEIRADIKKTIKMLDDKDEDLNDIKAAIKAVIIRVKDMIIKEENILLPKLSDLMSFYDWIMADQGSDEIGYFLEKPQESWKVEEKKEETEEAFNGEVKFDAGALNHGELNAIFNTLPLDMTFVDKDGHVKYFTQGKERIFDRPKTVIGRHVSLCHPPQSVHIVEDIINSFKSGEKDHEDFYINFKDMFVFIQYYAVRDKEKNYLGTLEITQDIKPIQAISGEKRLVSK
ncbi:MAG: DUF438 domain-containing protein [Candidatus Izemoplasmatales bacterium]|nr:DUF438 domain-containing protein [Candidatus Izemoplasmatales bacterium]